MPLRHAIWIARLRNHLRSAIIYTFGNGLIGHVEQSSGLRQPTFRTRPRRLMIFWTSLDSEAAAVAAASSASLRAQMHQFIRRAAGAWENLVILVGHLQYAKFATDAALLDQ